MVYLYKEHHSKKGTAYCALNALIKLYVYLPNY